MLRGIDELARSAGRDSRLCALVDRFTTIVTGRHFPCIYAMLPYTTSEIYFDLIEGADPVEAVVASLAELARLISRVPDAVAVLFVECPGAQTLKDDFMLASRIVRAVIRRNESDHPGVSFPDPFDACWELPLGGVGLFLNFSTPRHQARRSRNVGPCFTIIAQERASFDRQGRGAPKSREIIRRRLRSYDTVPPHPSLGSYHDADSREVLQFFLGDGLMPMDPTGACHHAAE